MDLSQEERREFERLKWKNAEYAMALNKIILESGKVDIANWPAQQQICQSIAREALKRRQV